MHYEVKQFIKNVKKHLPHKFRNRTVLEVGSHNINGSPRRYFWFCRYWGIDLYAGKGVNIVSEFNDYTFKRDYQVVISTEMLEHDSNWENSLKKMYNLLQPGGLLIITCAGPERPEHGTKRTSPDNSPCTLDYYRNISKEDFRSVLPSSLFEDYVLQYARGENDLQFYGVKKKLINLSSAEIYRYLLKKSNDEPIMMQNYGK